MSGERLGMSEREYARHAGVSRGAVQKARSSGRLVLHPDGSVDVAASDARRAQATDPSKQRSHTPPGGLRPVPPPGFRPVPPTGFRPVPEAAVAAVGETLKEQGLAAPASGMTFLQARTANEVLKARLRRMEVQQKEGELVDRARAVALVFRLARQERDVWLGWPARVASLIAAELGVDANELQAANMCARISKVSPRSARTSADWLSLPAPNRKRSVLQDAHSPWAGSVSGSVEDGDEELHAGWNNGLGLDPALTASAWSDRYRILSPRGANEAGPWRTHRTPYLQELMDTLSPRHPAQRVVFMKGSQLGASESGCNWIGDVIHHAPGPTLCSARLIHDGSWNELAHVA